MKMECLHRKALVLFKLQISTSPIPLQTQVNNNEYASNAKMPAIQMHPGEESLNLKSIK